MRINQRMHKKWNNKSKFLLSLPLSLKSMCCAVFIQSLLLIVSLGDFLNVSDSSYPGSGGAVRRQSNKGLHFCVTDIFFKDFIYLFLERERERETSMCGCLFCTPVNPLVHSPALSPLSHTSQGSHFVLKLTLTQVGPAYMEDGSLCFSLNSPSKMKRILCAGDSNMQILSHSINAKTFLTSQMFIF